MSPEPPQQRPPAERQGCATHPEEHAHQAAPDSHRSSLLRRSAFRWRGRLLDRDAHCAEQGEVGSSLKVRRGLFC